MRIRVWNAYASNNSGSYTIVGTFRDPNAAIRVAAELEAVIAAQSEWSGDVDGSPLQRWVVEQGLTWTAAHDSYEYWPEYGAGPELVTTNHQVIIFADYTLGLPSAFGEFIYRQGGIVQRELVHTHGPLLCVFQFWVPWEPVSARERLVELWVQLASDDQPFREHMVDVELVLRNQQVPHAFEVAAIFDDIIGGVSAARDRARSAGVKVGVRIEELLVSPDQLVASLRSAWATSRDF